MLEIGTIIGDKAYSVQYIADASRYADYLPTVQKMIDSQETLGTSNGLIHTAVLYLDNCRPNNPGGWFHYNNIWVSKGMMEACTCDLGAWSCVTWALTR